MKIWRTLVWKEWHELKWKALALSSIVVGVLAWIRTAHPEALGNVLMVLVWYFPLAAIFVAAHVAAGESSRGTYGFLSALPVNPRQVLAAKLLVGAGVCVLPVLAATLVPLPPTAELPALAGATPSPLRFAIGAVGASWTLFLWTVAAGIGRKREWHAGVAGVVVLVVWGAALKFAAAVLPAIARYGPIAEWLAANQWNWWDLSEIGAWVSPIGWIMFAVTGFTPAAFLGALAQVVTLGALVAWSLRRSEQLSGTVNATTTTKLFGKASPIVASSRKTRSHAHDQLLSPRRHPGLALAWLQWRQVRPLCLALFVFATVFTGIEIARGVFSPTGRSIPSAEVARTAASVFSDYLKILGPVFAMLMAIAAFGAELRGGLHAFWRSRPVAPTHWFWSKYATGTAVLLAVGLPAAVRQVIAIGSLNDFSNDSLVYASSLHLPAIAHLLVAYALAVFFVCSLRHGMYAAILAFACFLVVQLGPTTVPALTWLSLETTAGKGVVVGLILILPLLSWQAVRKDFALGGS